MPISANKPQVKGTTRVSYNDRKLVRRLYSADKNSRQVKQRRKRELTKDDREQLAQTPHARAEKALREWLKKARGNEQLLEIRESDDRLAMKAMSDIEWNELVRRRARMQSLHAALSHAKIAPKGAKKCAKEAEKLLQDAANAVAKQSNDDVPLLADRKHERCFNYRRKRQRRSAVMASIPALQENI